MSEPARRTRRVRLIAAAGAAGLLAAAVADTLHSTALLVALGPKVPPFTGDA